MWLRVNDPVLLVNISYMTKLVFVGMYTYPLVVCSLADSTQIVNAISPPQQDIATRGFSTK